MKRTKRTQPGGGENLTAFLKDFMVQVNDGIHREVEDSQDYLDKHELNDYITEDGHLDLTAVNDNEDLTVEQVARLGANHAWYAMHRNWHDVMENVAKDHGLSKVDIDGAKEVANLIGKLPPEIRDTIKEALGDILGGKKGKK